MNFLTIHSWFFALAAVVWAVSFEHELKKRKLAFENSWSQTFWILLAGFLGARIGYVLIYLDQFENLGQILNVLNGGLVSYTGAVSGLLVAWLFFKDQKQVWQAFLRSALLAWGIGRIGNYLMGDTPGITDISPALIESLICFSLYLLPYDEFILITYYLLMRFIADVWRIDETIFGLSVSMWGSFLSLILLLKFKWFDRKVIYPCILICSTYIVNKYFINIFPGNWGVEWPYLRLNSQTLFWAVTCLILVTIWFKNHGLGFWMIVSGVITNIVNQIYFGTVPDYLPVFGWYTNLPDILIIIGILLVLKRNYGQHNLKKL